MNNPYISQGPLQDARMFFGRDYELNEICAFLRGSQSVSIIGPREIGKTSLMVHLMRTQTKAFYGIEADYLFTYLDCHALCDCNQSDVLTFFGRVLANDLNASCLESEPALNDAISNPTWFTFEIALHKLNLRGVRVVLILDEFEQLAMNPHLDLNFFTALRSMASRLLVSHITCSTQPLIELTNSKDKISVSSSPFFNIFAQIYLGLLSEAEAHELIRKPMEACGRDLSSQIEDFIYQLVGGHPLALQIACTQAWEDPQDSHKIELRTKRELEGHFQNYWLGLTQPERDVLQHPIETRMREDSDPSLRRMLSELIRKCMLVRKDNSYRYPSKLWAEFIASQKNEALPLSSSEYIKQGN
jgi:hypothetical protein